MKITIYELLGRVKDGKAPKKIKYKYKKYNFDDYGIYTKKIIKDLLFECDNNLNDEVEILEEEKKIPEKEDELIRYNIQEFDDLKEFVEITTNDVFGKINKIINKQNKIIDYLDYFKSKGE